MAILSPAYMVQSRVQGLKDYGFVLVPASTTANFIIWIWGFFLGFFVVCLFLLGLVLFLFLNSFPMTTLIYFFPNVNMSRGNY